MKKKFSIIMVIVLLLGFIPINNVQADSNISNPEFIELLDDLVNSEIEYGLSGAQIAAYKDGKLIKNSAYGYINNYENVKDEYGNIIVGENRVLRDDEKFLVTNDTLFDLASNTKMFATVYALQKLVSENKISLDTKIYEIFPEFLEYANENKWKEKIDLKMILSHRAGFVASPKYHDENYDEADQIKNGKNDLYSQDRDTTFNMIMKTPLVREPNSKWEYSDVDMMLAGFIIEKITGQDLDTYVKENIYQPLSIDEIRFNPLENNIDKNNIAATEVNGNTRGGRRAFNNVRKYVLQGEVHDEKAFHSFDGIAGHAGLFGSAKQLAYLSQAMLNGGVLDDVQLFNQDTIDKFTEVSELSTQTLGGWRRKSETGGAATWFSEFAPAGTIGHTGWTGTLSLIDKENNFTMFLNTNARNTPIMGPKDNDFYTKNSNIASYGLVSELLYRALGLADDKSVDDVLMGIIESEITDIDLESQLPSKRNVIRSLMDVLENRSKNSQVLLDYLNSDNIQSIISELEKTYMQDVLNIKLLETPSESEKETDKEETKEETEVETEAETQVESEKEIKEETKKENKTETKHEIKNENNYKNDKSNNPKTGDDGIGIYIMNTLIAIGAIIFIRKSRMHYYKEK